MKRFIITLIVGLLFHLASAQSTYRFQYWFDHQFSDRVILSSTDGNWQTPLETGLLSEGFHTLYIQVQDSNGQWFSPQSYLFYRLSDTVQTYPVYYACWFDNDIEHQRHDSVSVGNFLLETSGINTGFHTVNFQFRYRDVITLKSHLFYKAPLPPSDTDRMEYAIWFDQDFEHRQTGQLNSGHLVLDVDSLPTGFHVLNAQFGSVDNATIKSYYFYKRPHEEIQINRYEYWFNDEDSLKRTFSVNPQDTLDVISLIAADTIPIRSTYFHFAPNGGNPIVNAKNDIHFRFYSVNGRYIQKDIPYVDINVVDTIYADTLERDTTKVITSPRNNKIHWFKLAAGRGDSLSFHTDRPCTIQLYAPGGEMVFQATGSDVLAWDGCHAWENGDYYLAVHDAEDTGTIAVSYQWINRYAVLAWDVHRVGNVGLSTITFQGNGFNSLDTIYLMKGTDTIPALYIGRESNTTTAVIFNFENVDTGMYQAVFMYEDEDLYKSSVVCVEEARPIVLTTTCSFPRSFVRGSTVTYTYTITNTGNMTAYNVPLHLYIATPSKEGISRIKVDGFNLPLVTDNWDMDSFSPAAKKAIIDWAESLGDELYFERCTVIDSITGDSTFLRANYFLANIVPYGTMNFSIKITAIDSVDVWMGSPDSIPILKHESSGAIAFNTFYHTAKSSYASPTCCVLEILSCDLNVRSIQGSVASIAAAFTGVGVTASIAINIANCVNDHMQSWVAKKQKEYCMGDNVNPNDLLQNLSVVNLTTNKIFDCGVSILSSLLSAGKLLTILKDLGNVTDLVNIGISALGNYPFPYTGFSTVDCTISTFKKQNCGEGGDEGGGEGGGGGDGGGGDSGGGDGGGGDSGGDGGGGDSGGGDGGGGDSGGGDGGGGDGGGGDGGGGDGSGGSGSGGGISVPTASYDPNDITGYLAESGSHAVGAEQIELPYMIEFENDTAFATANAHTVVVRDTLDGRVFDLNSFKATSFSIGEDITPISGGQSFVRTVDMRPAINVIAQVQLDYSINTSFAVATWTFSSLDPMTLLPTTDPTQGFLPANFNEDGIGEVTFTINRKANLRDSTLINNRAWIIFDNEAPIATSTWHNIMDVTPPTSTIDTVIYGGGTAKVAMHATDNLSGVWRYHVYGQLSETWLPLAMNIPVDSIAFVNAEEGQYDVIRTAAIDSAGNVEPLKVVPLCTVYDTISVTTCNSYIWYDSVYTTSGDYVRTRTSVIPGECDSIITLHLTLFHSFPLDITAKTWHAISTPMHNTAHGEETVDGVTNLVGDGFTYDLYYYGESDATWFNYKASPFALQPGRGYIYRRSESTTINFNGMPNSGGDDGIEIALTASCGDNSLRGFNLIGNPYPHPVNYNAPYYELLPTGSWYAHPAGVIGAVQGFLVHTESATTYNFADMMPTKGLFSHLPTPILKFTITGRGYEDVAYAIFGEGASLPKMAHLNNDAPELSIGGRAIALLDRETTEFPMALRACPGEYTITAHLSSSLSQFSYIHLIDRISGSDNDLLVDSTYSFSQFVGTSVAERFLVRLSPDEDSTLTEVNGKTFVHIDAGNVVVVGSGTLLGRLVFVREIYSGVRIPISNFHPGVYTMQLGGKKQRIVIM